MGAGNAGCKMLPVGETEAVTKALDHERKSPYLNATTDVD